MKLGIVEGKCKGLVGWMVRLADPDTATSLYCISTERGDTIVKVTRNSDGRSCCNTVNPAPHWN